MQEERIYWFEEAALKLRISLDALYDYLISSGFCYMKHEHNRPVAYKKFAKPIKLRKEEEHGFFVRKKSDDGKILTFITQTGLEFIQSKMSLYIIYTHP